MEGGDGGPSLTSAESVRFGSAPPPDEVRGRRRIHSPFGYAAVACAAATIGIALYMSRGTAGGFEQGFGDVAILTAAVLAVLACAHAAKRPGPDARGWALLALAAAVWAAGQAIWTLRGFTHDHVHLFPSAADIGYLGYAVPAAVALLAFQRRAVSQVTRLRGLLDGLVIGTSILFISWAFVIGPAYRAGTPDGLAWATGLAYPVVDAAMVSLVLVLAMRQPQGFRPQWVLLGAGLIVLALTDSSYVSLTLRGESGLTGTVLTAGWVAAFLMIALAALVPLRRSPPTRPHSLSLTQEFLPYLPVGVAFVAAASQPVFEDPFLLWDGAAVLALVGIRQAILLIEKVALTNELEDRVRQRTVQLERASQDLHEAFDKTPIGMAWANMAGVLVQVNPVLCTMLGRTRDELVGSSVKDITYPDDWAASEQSFRRAAATPEAHLPQIEKRYRHADGHEIWAQVDLLVTRDTDGSSKYLVAHVQDVSDRRSAAQELANQTNFLEAILENLDSGVVACDAEGRLTLINRVSRDLHGLSSTTRAQEWAERYALYRADGITPLPMKEVPLFRALRGERVRNAEVVLAAKDADPRTLLVNGLPLTDDEGARLGAVMATHDVTDRRKAEAALNRQALHDPLTDLPNRALLLDRLEHAIARQAGQPGPLALLLLDLDSFKLVNDSLGHASGDFVLVTLSQRLRARLRPYDTIARLGGDEFAVVLENVSEALACGIAEEIQTVIREPITVQGRLLVSDASVGIVMSTALDTPESLVRNADLAMYAAKDLGKGNVQVFNEVMHETVLQRLTLDSELRAAIEGRQFFLLYQPIVSLITGRLQGFEALIRWRHPERGVVYPDTFIPLAESTGLIVPLGEWVLREACRQARTWHRIHAAAEELTMSVNLSVRQLQDPGILGVVASALADSGLGAGLLALEITESVIDQRGPILPTLEALHAAGIRLALDDFGSGYSSLGRMHSMPLDRVKIDKSFIDALSAGNPAPKVAAAISMAHSLGLQTVAEGVESADQLPFLRLHGCDEAQGYLFGRPMAAALADAMLGERGTGTSWTDPSNSSVTGSGTNT